MLSALWKLTDFSNNKKHRNALCSKRAEPSGSVDIVAPDFNPGLERKTLLKIFDTTAIDDQDVVPSFGGIKNPEIRG
jgi:hypothetical protein